MKKKLLIFMSLLICVGTLAFAERRTRVDTYKNYTIKHIWNDNNRSGPDSSNWAKERCNDTIATWDSVTVYHYLRNPNSTVRAATMTIYKGSYYLVEVEGYKEGMWETIFREKTYDYGLVRRSIDDFCSLDDVAIAAGM